MSKIAIFSDTHDQVANLQAAINYCNQERISTAIHCGDLISPFMLKQLTKLNGEVHLVFGNNMGDRRLLDRCENEFNNLTHHGTQAELTLFNKKIAVVHYPDKARILASSNAYDIVCYGHDHTHRVTKEGSTVLINPGQLMGHRPDTGFVVLDCDSMELQQVEVDSYMFAEPVSVSGGPMKPVERY